MLPIVSDYFTENNSIDTLLKIDTWINLEAYLNLRSSQNIEDKNTSENIDRLVIENHNILNVLLFALSIISFKQDLMDMNIHLQNLDSNKLSIFKVKILVKEFVQYLDFNVVEKDLTDLFWFFDFKYPQYDLDNFIYIGELLNLYNSSKSEYFKFTQLVSIIEFLLTKWNKDLTKQFVFKSWVIIERLIMKNQILDKKHFNLVLFDNKETIKELESIYDIRSHIVHWDIKGMNLKYPFSEWQYNDFRSNFYKLKSITAWLLYLYIQEPEYIDFLKNN